MLRECKGKYFTKDGYVEFSHGLFHKFSTGYDEFECGPGNYSTAIVELTDGTVVEVLATDIQFTDKPVNYEGIEVLVDTGTDKSPREFSTARVIRWSENNGTVIVQLGDKCKVVRVCDILFKTSTT